MEDGGGRNCIHSRAADVAVTFVEQKTQCIPPAVTKVLVFENIKMTTGKSKDSKLEHRRWLRRVHGEK